MPRMSVQESKVLFLSAPSQRLATAGRPQGPGGGWEPALHVLTTTSPGVSRD